MTIVYTYIEKSVNETYQNEQPTIHFTTISNKPLIAILNNFKFRSDKSLIEFLKQKQNLILEGIPITEKLLISLENQQFLKYLDAKWYDTNLINNDEIVSPDQILDLAMQYNIIKSKDLIEYLLEDREHYTYELLRGVLHQ